MAACFSVAKSLNDCSVAKMVDGSIGGSLVEVEGSGGSVAGSTVSGEYEVGAGVDIEVEGSAEAVWLISEGANVADPRTRDSVVMTLKV